MHETIVNLVRHMLRRQNCKNMFSLTKIGPYHFWTKIMHSVKLGRLFPNFLKISSTCHHHLNPSAAAALSKSAPRFPNLPPNLWPTSGHISPFSSPQKLQFSPHVPPVLIFHPGCWSSGRIPLWVGGDCVNNSWPLAGSRRHRPTSEVPLPGFGRRRQSRDPPGATSRDETNGERFGEMVVAQGQFLAWFFF